MPPIRQGSRVMLIEPCLDPVATMLALPHNLIRQHREIAAVLAAYALFLSGALPLICAVG